MAKDIVPELLKAILESFRSDVKADKELETIIIKANEGIADYKDAERFAKKTGEMLSRTLQKQITSESLPDGKMYYNIADRVLNTVLKEEYDLVTDVSEMAQSSLNKKAKIGIKAIKPEFNQDRVDGMVNKLSNKDNFESVRWVLDKPVVNFSQSIVDDSVRVNADFHAKAGMRPKIIRIMHGGTCKWCKAKAGVWDYVKDDIERLGIFQRHQNCNCEVLYNPGNGTKRVQDVYSKRWTQKSRKELMKEHLDKDKKKIEERKQLSKQSVYLLENKAVMHYGKGIILNADYSGREEFKLKVLKSHAFYAKYGIQTSEHYNRNLLGRINNGRIKSEGDVIKLLGKKPNYVDTRTHNDVRYYDGLALITDSETGDLITTLDRGKINKDWVKIYD